MKNLRTHSCTAVIVAGGSSVRFGADKLFMPLAGKPVLARTIEAFESADSVTDLVVVAGTNNIERIRALCESCSKPCAVVPGGSTRLLSACAGIMQVPKKSRLIAIHDGARPLVTPKLIDDAVWAAHRTQAAAPAMPVRQTIKQARDGVVVATPDRSSLYAVQTPQVFQAQLITAALYDAQTAAPDLTDDCAAVERIGAAVTLIPGDEENIKITTPLDLALAELIIQRREKTCE